MHNIYSYHAKFNPDIPKKFIKQYSNENDVVLDPFCGCGTTLLEGLKLKRNVIGVDLSPIGILCAKVKTNKYNLEKIIEYSETILKVNPSNCNIPDFPNRELWFNSQVLTELGMLNYNILKIEDTKYRDLFYLILLSILNNCSRKRKTWNLGYIADNCLPNIDRNVDAIKLYKQQLDFLIKRKDFIKQASNNTVECIESDIMKTNITGVNLVVTSPPYPFAVDFIRYHRLALYWMGKQVEALSNEEVGARNKRNKKNCEKEFFNQMELIYLHVMKMVKSNGYWCMTIGDTTRCHVKIDFVSWTIKLFEDNGWKLVKKSYRYLKQQTMAQKRIKTESILIFQKL
ncbi:hypothetical protein II906_11890 [bacterium]|nr:hypothetical protein [bacterium]